MTVRELIRDGRAARGVQDQYRQDAARLAILARDHRHLGHSLFARQTEYWRRVVERAALAEATDPEPRG